MSNNIKEEEIKIEYFESLDVDPLCENIVTQSSEDCRSNESFKSFFLNENIDQNTSNVIETFINNITEENLENSDPIISNKEETWYKIINDKGRYQCKYCNLSYSTIQTVRHHVKTKHADQYSIIKSTAIMNIRRQKLKCHICKKQFKNKCDMQEHIQTHGINNIQNSCFICHATFITDSEMLTHLSDEHKSDKRKKYLCIICGYSTSKVSHYKQHENTHIPYSLKKCSYCEYTTYHPPNLRIHERTHTNDKPYSCAFNGCDYRCAAKAALYSHQLKHDKENNLLYCDKCSYSTVYKQSLKKHLDSHARNSIRIDIF